MQISVAHVGVHDKKKQPKMRACDGEEELIILVQGTSCSLQLIHGVHLNVMKIDLMSVGTENI